jgi:hypothetical protein
MIRGSNGGGFYRNDKNYNFNEGVNVSGDDGGACVDACDDAMVMVIPIMVIIRCLL